MFETGKAFHEKYYCRMAQKRTPQETPLSVRLTITEKVALTQAAHAQGMNRNAYVREVLNKSLPKELRRATK